MVKLAALCVSLALTVILQSEVVIGGSNGQGNRVFEEICEDCVVSKGTGFVADPIDCNCFYQCNFVGSYKLSSMASPWVSVKQCCACGMSWSTKFLTCVPYRNKQSDCYLSDINSPLNVCDGETDGTLVPRGSPLDIFASPMCAGFVRCENVQTADGGTTVVPYADCCETDECFDEGAQDCTVAACGNTPACTASFKADQDCQKPTPAPVTECLFTSVPSDITMFMAKETMESFECAAGTCWDDDLCTCVATNNTAYRGFNDCDRPFLETDFSGNGLNVEDGSGNLIWSEGSGNLEISGGQAEFEGEEYIIVGGTANTYLSNTFVAHIELVFRDSAGVNEPQCVFGNCVNAEQGTGEDTVSVTVTREEGDPTDLDLHVLYQESAFMLGEESMESAELNIEGNFETETDYEIWVIYCGETETVTFGVLDEGSETVVGEVANHEVDGSTQLIMGQSGFVFGSCPSAIEGLDALVDEIEFWRYCKPYGNAEFVSAIEEFAEA